MAFSLLNKFKKSTSAQGDAAPSFSGVKPPVHFEKGKPFSGAKGARFVLMIGDDGAVLVHMHDKKVLSRHFVPDTSDRNLSEFSAVVAREPRAPIMLLIDSMDQSFIQQTLPPVSSMSVNKLIKRRLERDFAADVIKGAVVLARDKTGRKDWNFLMVSLEKSPQLTAWLAFIDRAPNRLKGIYLASVEAEVVVKNLERAMGIPKESNTSRWKFFVSHNKVGGFRQVILRDGKIIFTRLAQPVGEATAEVIAGNIEQEMASTIEYMKRLSFNPQEGLDVYIIASAEIAAKLDTNRFPASAVYKFTPFEIAEFFELDGAAQQGDKFGDVVLAASIGASKQHRLVLSTPQSRQIEQVSMAMQYEYVGGVIVAIGMVLYAASIGYNVVQSFSVIEDLKQKKNAQQHSYDELKAEVSKSNLDVKKIIDALDLYGQIQSENVTPVGLLARLHQAIQSPMVITQVTWDLGAPTGAAAAAAPAAPGAPGVKSFPGPQMTLVVNLRFPAIVSTPETFSATSKKVIRDVKSVFVGYDAKFITSPQEFVEHETQDITFDDKQYKAAAAKQVEAKLQIVGPAVFPTKAMYQRRNGNAVPGAADPAAPVEGGAP